MTGKMYEAELTDLTSDWKFFTNLDKDEFLLAEFGGMSTFALAATAVDWTTRPPIEKVYRDFLEAIQEVLDPEAWKAQSISPLGRLVAQLIMEYEAGDEPPFIRMPYRFRESSWLVSSNTIDDSVDWYISNSHWLLGDIWNLAKEKIANRLWNDNYVPPSEEDSGNIMSMKRFLVSECLPWMMADKELVEALFHPRSHVLVWANVNSANPRGYSYQGTIERVTEEVQRLIRAMGCIQDTMDLPTDSNPREVKLTPTQFHRIRTVPFTEDPELGFLDRITMTRSRDVVKRKEAGFKRRTFEIS